MFKQTETKIPQIADNLCLDVAKRKQLHEFAQDLFTKITNAGEETYSGRYKDEEVFWSIQNYLAGDAQSHEVKINMPKIKSIENKGKTIGQQFLEHTPSFDRAQSFYNASCILLKECGVECALIMANHWYDCMFEEPLWRLSPND